MKQLIQNFETGAIKVIETPAPALGRRSVLVQTLYSVVSAGTERATVSVGQQSLLGKARSRPDLVKKVLEKPEDNALPSRWRARRRPCGRFADTLRHKEAVDIIRYAGIPVQ